MEYVKGSPYFCQTKTKLRQYPYLDKKLNCENHFVMKRCYRILANLN